MKCRFSSCQASCHSGRGWTSCMAKPGTTMTSLPRPAFPKAADKLSRFKCFEGPGCLMLSHCSGAKYPLRPLSRWVVCLNAPLPSEMIRTLDRGTCKDHRHLRCNEAGRAQQLKTGKKVGVTRPLHKERPQSEESQIPIQACRFVLHRLQVKSPLKN